MATPGLSLYEWRVVYRLAAGFLIVVLAVAGLVLFPRFRPKVGELLIRLGERINGSAKSQPLDISTQLGSAQAMGQTEPAKEAEPNAVETEVKPVEGQKETQGNSALPVDASKQVNTQTSDTAISRPTPTTDEAANRPADQGAASSRQGRSAKATLLWSEVASGDSSAEMDLARLYLTGEGVLRNCVQAKVLLRAAAKGGSAEARQELKKLRRNACR